MDKIVWGLRFQDWRALAMFMWGVAVGTLYITYVPQNPMDVVVGCGVLGLFLLLIPATAKGGEEAAKEIRGVV